MKKSKAMKRLEARRNDYIKMLASDPKKNYISPKSGRPAYHRPGSNNK
jgi:hypothetical protein